MDGFFERAEASFGSLGRSPVENTTHEPVHDEMWSLDRTPCFRSSSQPLEDDNSAEEEAAERLRRAYGSSTSDDSDADMDVPHSDIRDNPDYDESIGVRASIAFCSQLDREAERDEVDIASLQFDYETNNKASAPVPKMTSAATTTRTAGGRPILQSVLKGGRENSSARCAKDRRVSFNLPPLPKPYLPPHKRGSSTQAAPSEDHVQLSQPEGDTRAGEGEDTVPDYVKHPDRYVKYEFDEPAVIGL